MGVGGSTKHISRSSRLIYGTNAFCTRGSTFTPWKGSVVDSVVGVFLTHIVSDHLSSNAFMSLVREFPAPSLPSMMPSIRITYLDSEELLSNSPIQNQSSPSLNNTQPDEDEGKDYIDSDETSRSSSSEVTSSVHESVGKIRKDSALEVDKRDQTNLVHDLFPSEDSLLTCQEYSVSGAPKNTERAGSSSGINSEHYPSFARLGQGLRSVGLQGKGRDFITSDIISVQESNQNNSRQEEELLTETTLQDFIESTRRRNKSLKNDYCTLTAKGKVLKEEKERFDWDRLRREAEDRVGKRKKTTRTMDAVDWEGVRRADVKKVAEIIKSRGIQDILAERIQAFLNRLVKDHGSIDLEWLRDVHPEKVKDYLYSFKGLGVKSVECLRLLTLHDLAFPVDTNVGRIAVRLGWVPLQPSESLQLHLLKKYPTRNSVQKYLWPFLCKFDQKTLYELHFHMISFGKVFCRKKKPNCYACPMRGECRYFASACASSRLALPCRERTGAQLSIPDIEDGFYEDPTIRLNMNAFTTNLKKKMEHKKELKDGNMSTSLVAVTAEAASLPMPMLKNISRLRTEHEAYELPDSHPLLAEFGKRESDNPCSYLLVTWTPGESVDSVQQAVSKSISEESGKLCHDKTGFSCNTIKDARLQTVRGTILIPCRTATRGRFPLNGTYFQINEVFADHHSSLNPIDVPRKCLWGLPRRTVYFGTSIPSIFRGLPAETIRKCFWRGSVCVRGFDRKTRAPKPLIGRLHFPASK